MTPTEAVSALTALGYSNLLTTEALQITRPTKTDSALSILGLVLPLALLGVALFFILRLSRRNGAVPRDSSSFRTIMPPAPPVPGVLPDPTEEPITPSVRLDDVAGCDEAKLELTETIEFLRTPERFHKLGARIPRGIMLYGPPGTGKTMLARAVAAEAGVPFHHASGSEFVEKYVGVGARRIRDMFAQARKLGRGVIFFDEFDAIGKARGGPNSHEEREQTLNQLLVELDGFGTTEDVIVIAATNRLDTLDPAVLRPGRFNRKIHVGLPDVVGRAAILDVHARNKPLATTIDLGDTARKTYGFSGADARRPAQRGGDPRRPTGRRGHRSPRTSTAAGSRSPSARPAGGRWTSASVRSLPPTRSVTRSAARSTATSDGSRRSRCSPTARRSVSPSAARRTTTCPPRRTCGPGSSP